VFKHVTRQIESWEWYIERLSTKPRMFYYGYTSHWYVLMWNTVHQWPVWSPCYQKDKLLIERVQYRFTRMIPGFSKLPYHERLEQLGLWSLELRRNRADIIEVFKMAKCWSAIPLESMFELSTTKHLRGHTLKLVKHRSTLSETQLFHRKTNQ